MKTQRNSFKRGFTLMELMVAMAITTIIVTVLVSITSIALDTWNRSRAELRASRQAKSMIDIMARDFESFVSRKSNKNEWLSATSDPSDLGEKMKSTNATKLIFFTAATDRYEGKIGDPVVDLGGDVSCVAYQLEYKDPINPGAASSFKSFVLSRLLIDPKNTYDKLLGKTNIDAGQDLETVFNTGFAGQITQPKYFVCENIFQFSVTFQVQAVKNTGTVSEVVTLPVTIGRTDSLQTSKNFKIQGSGIVTQATGGNVTPAELAAGRVTAVEISATVLSDFAVERIKTQVFKDAAAKSKFMAQNSYEYTKVVPIPSM
jgi:prepilin-type N-terminal cleavage/methylation domain-containing protein